MTTIKDIAQYTGLSIATISKYINGGNVLDSNRESIAEAISALDYKVNMAARVLKTRRTRIVGVLLPSLTIPFFSSICAMLEGHLKKEGYAIILCSYYDDPKVELEKIQFLLRQSVDGLLLVPQSVGAQDFEAFSEIRERRTPLVLMDRHIPGYECDSVLADNSGATYSAVEQLVINGHKRIGIILGPQDITTAKERRLGYERVHSDYGLALDATLIRAGDYSISFGYNAMSELLCMPDPPTAVVGTNHDVSMGAVTFVYERKLRIPDDISFIGYDEIQLTKIINPPITIVTQPCEEIARQCASILLRRMRGDASSFPDVCRLKTNLLLNGSVKRIGIRK